MLSCEENELFTKVGPGTKMGEVLRRYWHPVGASQWVGAKPQRVKVLDEELLLYRGSSGPVLMQLRCAHRSLALDHGRVEGDCIRCAYHGWLYDPTGQCLEQPAEPQGSSFKDKVRLRAYKVQEAGGLVFGYLGPEPAPLLPLYDLLTVEEGVKAVQVQTIHANWFNHVENIVDTSHLAWLHGGTFNMCGGKKIDYLWEKKPYGLDNVLLIDGVNDTHRSCYIYPTANRFTIPPVAPGGEPVRSLLYRVPNDDASTTLFFVRWYPSAKHELRTMTRPTKLGEYQADPTDWWGIHVNDQDRMVAEQQGVIADRPHEHLGVSDEGLIQMRQMMRQSLAAVAAGRDPLFVIRDPARQRIAFQLSEFALSDRPRELAGNF